MYSTESLEWACSDAWPAVVEDKLGDWRLRAATHRTESGDTTPFTGRANSALAVGDCGMPTPDALNVVREFAHDNGIDPVVQAVVDSRVETELAANGWRPRTEHGEGHLVSVQTGDVDSPAGRFAGPGAAIQAEPTPGWWELALGRSVPTHAQRHVLTTGEVGYGSVPADEGPTDHPTAGTVRAVVVGDLVYVSSLAVRAEYRRMGVASELMAAARAWGRARGAAHCVLQVAVTNDAALALYRRLGFAEHHRYRYWVPSTAGARPSATGPSATCEDQRP